MPIGYKCFIFHIQNNCSALYSVAMCKQVGACPSVKNVSFIFCAHNVCSALYSVAMCKQVGVCPAVNVRFVCCLTIKCEG